MLDRERPVRRFRDVDDSRAARLLRMPDLTDRRELPVGQDDLRPARNQGSVGGYRELAKTYDRIATSISQFAAQSSASAQALTGSAEQIADPELKNRVAEAQDLVEQRSQVTNTFIADWKKLGQATNGYATALDQAFLQGNKAVCPAVDKGVQAKTAGEVLVSCNKNFDKAKNAVEEKLKELDEVAGGGSGEAPAE